MRITNSMTRNNVLWSLNKTEEAMDVYQTQMSTGKKIQKPSEDPIVAVRALKFRTNLDEVNQYNTNSEDAKSWLSMNEQAMDNSISLVQRVRELSVQGSSDTFTISDVDSMMAEIGEIRNQLVNEGNVSYAGRYVFTGFKTETPLVFTETPSPQPSYNITEHFSKDDLQTQQKAFDEVSTVSPSIPPSVEDVSRLRLGYDGLDASAVSIIDPATGVAPAGFTITEYDSSDTFASGGADISVYKPEPGNIHIIKDTGEIIFNEGNVDGTLATQIPDDLDISYDKSSFVKYDMVPENYFECVDNSDSANPINYDFPDDEMAYQISYNQSITVNTMGHDIITSDLIRDLDEIVAMTQSVMTNPETDKEEIFQSLQIDALKTEFNRLMGKCDDHLDVISNEEAIIGSKVNRLDLTIARLDDDKTNFTELLSNNEDVDMTEAYMNLKAQEIVYNAALASSSMIMQKSLIDFIS